MVCSEWLSGKDGYDRTVDVRDYVWSVCQPATQSVCLVVCLVKGRVIYQTRVVC